MIGMENVRALANGSRRTCQLQGARRTAGLTSGRSRMTKRRGPANELLATVTGSL